jgi:predicted nucleic acid-binding protein
MALVCDTGAVFGLYDADDTHHATIKAVVEKEPGPLFLPVVLLAEIDYLLSTRLGQEAALEFLESVEQGAFLLVPMTSADLRRCLELIRQYRDLQLGIADAAVAAVAERLGIQRLFTLDERHFRAIKPRGFSHFILFPTDADLPKRRRTRGRNRRAR